MAIDTENKRRSALRSVLPVASGTIAAADRRHAIRLYRFASAVDVDTRIGGATAARTGLGSSVAARTGLGSSSVSRTGIGSATAERN